MFAPTIFVPITLMLGHMFQKTSLFVLQVSVSWVIVQAKRAEYLVLQRMPLLREGLRLYVVRLLPPCSSLHMQSVLNWTCMISSLKFYTAALEATLCLFIGLSMHVSFMDFGAMHQRILLRTMLLMNHAPQRDPANPLTIK